MKYDIMFFISKLTYGGIMNYNLREISWLDKEFIYQVKKESNFMYIENIWGWDEDYQIQDINTDFKLSDYKIIVLENKDIGFIQLDESGNTFNITEIHIVPEYRGQAIGSHIINDILRDDKNHDKTITIGCFLLNQRAKNLYEKLGFKIINETETHYEMEYDRNLDGA